MFKAIADFLLLSSLASVQDRNSPLWRRYFAASRDARDAQPWKISRDLIAIVPSEKGLIWKKDDSGSSMVKVVTWVEYAAASDPEIYVVGPMTAAPAYDDSTLIWVTAEPELRRFCTAFRDEQNCPALTLRLQQVLGLPPVEVARSEFAEF